MRCSAGGVLQHTNTPTETSTSHAVNNESRQIGHPKRWLGQISIQLTWFNRDCSHHRTGPDRTTRPMASLARPPRRTRPDLAHASAPQPTQPGRLASPRLTPTWSTVLTHPSAPSAILLLPRPATIHLSKPRAPRPPLPSSAPRRTSQIPRVPLGASHPPTRHHATSPQSACAPEPSSPVRPGSFSSPSSPRPPPLAKARRCCVPAPWRHGTRGETGGGFAEPSGATAEGRVGGGRRFLVPSVSTACGRVVSFIADKARRAVLSCLELLTLAGAVAAAGLLGSSSRVTAAVQVSLTDSPSPEYMQRKVHGWIFVPALATNHRFFQVPLFTKK